MTTLSKPRFLKGGFTVGLLGAMIISATTLCVTFANAAPIYKVIDEKTGQVTFTDRPQSYEQQADKKVSQMAITTDATSDKPISQITVIPTVSLLLLLHGKLLLCRAQTLKR